MENQIIDVLAPYEDEVLVSWIVRMLKMYSGCKFTDFAGDYMRTLFGPTSSDKPGLYIQKGLQYFCNNISVENRNIFCSEETMWKKMTVVPFYLCFIPDEYKKETQESIFKLSLYMYAETKLGIRSNCRYIEGNGYYKFCPECFKHQKEYYLKREHQIQGNLVCWEHGCVLHKIPYSLRWKDIDFISKLEREVDVSVFDLSITDLQTAQEIATLIHEIFTKGFLDDVKILKMKILRKMHDEGVLSKRGFFEDWNAFSISLGANYLFDNKSLKSAIYFALGQTTNVCVNPIIYLFLIHRLFGSLENYYKYNANTSLDVLSKDILDYIQPIKDDLREIDDFLAITPKNFFEEYIILGDTDTSIIIKHIPCGNIYRTNKKAHRLLKCRACRKKQCYIKHENNNQQNKVQYCRYVNTKEFAKLQGKEMKQIRNYCNQNRIPGAIRVGKDILIPINAPYPKDMRYRQNRGQEVNLDANG